MAQAASAADDVAVLDELKRLPYVRAAGGIDQTPLSGSRSTYAFEVEGRVAPANQPQIDLRRATPGYFEAMGIPLRQGRTFAASDVQGAPLVAIVNERAARTIWPGENAVGRQIRAGGSAPLTIVGVVGDVRHLGLDRDPQPELYRAWAQEPMGSLSFVARVDRSPQQLIASLVEPGRTVGGGRRVRTATTFSAQVADSVRAPRFRMLLCALIGALVLAITIVGVAGVSAQAVAGSTRELGIRLAIGARPGQLVSLIVRQHLGPVALGCSAGLMAAWWIVRFVDAFVLGATVHDAYTFAGALVVLLTCAIGSAWLPARAAARLDPSTALRD